LIDARILPLWHSEERVFPKRESTWRHTRGPGFLLDLARLSQHSASVGPGLQPHERTAFARTSIHEPRHENQEVRVFSQIRPLVEFMRVAPWNPPTATWRKPSVHRRFAAKGGLTSP